METKLLSAAARKLIENDIADTRNDARWHRELAEGLERKAEVLANGLMDETRQALRLEDDGGYCGDASFCDCRRNAELRVKG